MPVFYSQRMVITPPRKRIPGPAARKIWPLQLACYSVVLFFLACSQPVAMLDRVYVKNASGTRITDVRITHEPAQWFGTVNAILPQKSLDVGFGGHPILARRATVLWRDSDDVEWSLDIELPYDTSLEKAGRPMSLIYIIYPAGRLDVHLLESVQVK